MKRTIQPARYSDLNHQGAEALLGSTLDFLCRNKMPEKEILALFNKCLKTKSSVRGSRLLGELISAHESMGVVMATWFSDPRFLDEFGNPLPLAEKIGTKSIKTLVQVSKARLELSLALDLMRQSPSIGFCKDGKVVAVKRVFVLPNLEIPRAAFAVDKYLNTLQRNASARVAETPLLLERSCHVSEIDLAKVAPLLRDIEARGTAFMDSIDGEIEDRRVRSKKRKTVGEMGVLVFAWTIPSNRTVKAHTARANESSACGKPVRVSTKPRAKLHESLPT